MAPEISAKMEDYLEAIARIAEGDGVARVRDIARSLGVTMASVTGAMKNLKERKLVNQQKYGYVTLTVEGRRVAGEVIKRHELLLNFFENVLGVGSETAAADACKIEHAVSEETLERIAVMAGFMEKTESARAGLAAEFARFKGRAGTGRKAAPRRRACPR